jgi:glucokinase
VEDALSGRGIEHLYAFVTHEAGRPAEANSADLMQRLALGEADARETAAIYVRLLGAFLGDLALIHLPFGGIFLIGGMTRAMAPSFAGMGLSAAFRDKGRFTDFLRSFSVSVVEDDFAALTGCAVHLCGEMAHRDPRRASLS